MLQTQNNLRNEVVEAAREHKASWVKLGNYLYAVFKDKLFRAWGYLSFETYCVKELGIKQATAQKMLKSYHFLETEEPQLLKQCQAEDPSPGRLPECESVNLLRLAKNNRNIDPESYELIREKALDQARGPEEVRKQVRAALENIQNADEDPREQRRRGVLRKFITSIRTNEKALRDEKLLPAYLLQQIADLIKKLEDQLDSP